jgi:hypothetical protein
MPPRKFSDYYWKLNTFLVEQESILDKTHPDYRFPEDDELVYYTHYLEGCLVFVDGSKLRFEVALGLGETYNVVEKQYFYGYFDRHGIRCFQYDNSPHHPELTSYPHHVHRGPRPSEGKDKALALDIPRVDFITVVSKIGRLLQDRDLSVK